MNNPETQPIAPTQNTQPIQDFDLPSAVLKRVIKTAVPEGFAVAKDATTCIAKAATVFVSMLTFTANEQIKGSARKSVNSQDVMRALEIMEMDQALFARLVPAIQAFQMQSKNKRDDYRRKTALKKAVGLPGDVAAIEEDFDVANEETGESKGGHLDTNDLKRRAESDPSSPPMNKMHMAE